MSIFLQAKALKLQQEVKEREAHLEQCYLRMERGEPPDEEMEMEWQKLLRQANQRAKEREQQMLVSFLNYFYFSADLFCVSKDVSLWRVQLGIDHCYCSIVIE